MANQRVLLRTSTGWQDIAVQGARGPQGAQGIQGATGATGSTGAQGPGVPLGGSIGYLLAKKSAADNDTQWQAGPMVGFLSTGGQPGNGSTLVSGTSFVDSGVPARLLTYNAPAYNTRARITWKSRWDKLTADWGWGGGGVKITPTPVADFDGMSGAINDANPIRQIYPQYGGTGNPIYTTISGSFWADFAPSTTYTIAHCYTAGSGTWQWDSTWKFCTITLEAYVR
jgi:hypothetical protein